MPKGVTVKRVQHIAHDMSCSRRTCPVPRLHRALEGLCLPFRGLLQTRHHILQCKKNEVFTSESEGLIPANEDATAERPHVRVLPLKTLHLHRARQ